ncbi:hypothetical protein CISIN_1g047373mg, partial [Citrus sinensis]
RPDFSINKSLENLNETCVQKNENKNLVLNPVSPLNVTEIPLFLSGHELTTRKCYTCNGYNTGHYCMADKVSPMSTISSITLLDKFNVKDVGGLEEKVVNLGVNEGLKLLKASLDCRTVLTSVFLGGTNV